MRSLKSFVARATLFELILTLSILTGCNSEKVTSPGPIVDPPSIIDVSFCALLQPTWLAFQDGDGAWTQIQPTVVGQKATFHYTITANHGAIALVRLLGNGVTALSVQYGLPSELTIVSDTTPAHCGLGGPKTLLGTVAGVEANDVAIVSGGFGSRDVALPSDGNAFALPALPDGPQAILASRITRVDGINVPTRLIYRRTPALPDSATIPVLDFGSPEAFPPATPTVTLVGEGVASGITRTELLTAYSRNEVSFVVANTARRRFFAIPEAQLQPGDLQALSVTAAPTSTNGVRSAEIFFRDPVDQTLTLGAPATPPAFNTVGTTPSLRLRATFLPQSDYDRLTSISYQQGQSTFVSVAMTAAYAATVTGGYALTIPELSGVAGFEDRWALRAGDPLFWVATRTGGTLGLGPTAIPTAGATVRTVTAFDALTP